MAMPLSITLQNWKDCDGAAFYLGASLGLWGYESDDFQEHKGIFWTNNILGTMLHNMLILFTAVGILEFDGDSKFRWNKDFDANTSEASNKIADEFPWNAIMTAGWPFNFTTEVLEQLADLHGPFKKG